MKKLLNQKGQGTTEYIVIIAIIIAVAVYAVSTKMGSQIKSTADNIAGQIHG